MTQVSAAHADAYALLRADLYEHLDEAEYLAMKYTAWFDEDVTAARAVIPDLVTVIRGVLMQHGTTAEITCAHCDGPWPCETVATIHHLVKDPDAAFARLLQAGP